jgi:hypothetical protein
MAGIELVTCALRDRLHIDSAKLSAVFYIVKIPSDAIISKVLHASRIRVNLFQAQTHMSDIVEAGNDSGRFGNRSSQF